MRRGSVLTLLLLVLECGLGAQDRSGRIEGRVLRGSGDALGGVSVVLNETSATAITGNDGRFVFGGLPAGRYSLTITLGENLTTIADVDVVAGAITPVERTVDWDVGFSETLVVSAPSRRVERIIDAPGAVTTVPAAEIEQRAAHAQLPKLLEFSPGVQVTQSGHLRLQPQYARLQQLTQSARGNADRRPRPVDTVSGRAGMGGDPVPARRSRRASSCCAGRARRSTAPTPRAACST